MKQCALLASFHTNLLLAPPPVCVSVSSICHETNMEEDVQFIVFSPVTVIKHQLRTTAARFLTYLLHDKNLPPHNF